MDCLDQTFRELYEWISDNGFLGWDPYDIKGSRFFVWVQNKSTKIFRVLSLIERCAPVMTRKILGVNKQVNAKAMALLALSYINLYKRNQYDEYLKKYKECIHWLVNHNHVNDSECLGWGYPFDWQSLIFIPRETPLCVPTVLVGHAMLDYYELSNEDMTKSYLLKIKNFLLQKLNRSYFNEKNMVCFSYSPLDDYLVINANLYTASFLTRYAIVFNDNEVLDLSRAARRFSISQQHLDGSWNYWSELYKFKFDRTVDNYHTGIVLQWLKICLEYDPGFYGEKEALCQGTDFYLRQLFTKEGKPKITENKVYPIDIHSIAQSLITFNYLADIVDKTLVDKVYQYAIREMKDSEGFFYYRKYKYGPTPKIAYLRWGQAWMLYALVNLLEYKLKVGN